MSVITPPPCLLSLALNRDIAQHIVWERFLEPQLYRQAVRSGEVAYFKTVVENARRVHNAPNFLPNWNVHPISWRMLEYLRRCQNRRVLGFSMEKDSADGSLFGIPFKWTALGRFECWVLHLVSDAEIPDGPHNRLLCHYPTFSQFQHSHRREIFLHKKKGLTAPLKPMTLVSPSSHSLPNETLDTLESSRHWYDRVPSLSA